MVCLITWEDKAKQLQVVEFDSYSEESHDLPCEVTEFPVELAAGMTDQIILKPKALTLTGYVGDKPLASNVSEDDRPKMSLQTKSLDLPRAPDYVQTTVTLDVPKSPLVYNAASLLTAAFNAVVGDKTEATVRKPGPDRKDTQDVRVWAFDDGFKSRSEAVWDLLKRARNERVQLRVITDFDDTDGYCIDDLQMSRTVDEGTGANFTLQLHTITVAYSDVTEAPKPAEPLGNKAKKLGGKPAESAEEKKAKLRSTLAAIVDATAGSLAGDGGHH